MHALGYVGKINQKEYDGLNESRYAGTDVIGKLGVEKFYEPVLHGFPGLQQVETNARGRVIRKLETIPAKPGKDIQLTIDIRLQEYIENTWTVKSRRRGHRPENRRHPRLHQFARLRPEPVRGRHQPDQL